MEYLFATSSITTTTTTETETTASISSLSDSFSDSEFETALESEPDQDDLDNQAMARFAIQHGNLSVICASDDPRDIDPQIMNSTSTNAINTLVMGEVQSGKSRVMFGLCLYLAIRHHKNVVVVLRDFICDMNQFDLNLESFLQDAIDDVQCGLYREIRDLFPILYAGDLRENGDPEENPRFLETFLDEDHGSITLSLCNTTQIQRLNRFLADIDLRQNVLIIDEVDDLMYPTGKKLAEEIHILNEHFKSTIGVSATIFDPVHDHRFLGSRVLLLPPPADYKGINALIFQTIPSIPITGSDDSNLFQVLDALQNTTIRSKGEMFPLIMLLKNERLIADQKNLLGRIRRRYDRKYTVIVFNGQEITLYAKGLSRETKYVLPTSYRKGTRKSNGTVVFTRGDIQDVLQFLKNNGGTARFPRILIISHNMIGRGINIVSRDFEWHLTHMYYRPSRSTTLPSMLHSMRLCGRYQDNIPLYLYAEESVIRDIQRGYRLQKELVDRIKTKSTADPRLSALTILENETVHPQKMPKRNVFLRRKKTDRAWQENENDTGLSLEEFQRGMCLSQMPMATTATTDDVPPMDPKEYHRLTNDTNGMFKKWGDVANTTAIARFMREGLDPHKKYTKQEMKDLCKTYGIQKISDIMKPFDRKAHAIGQILVCIQNWYQLSPQLLISFGKYF